MLAESVTLVQVPPVEAEAAEEVAASQHVPVAKTGDHGNCGACGNAEQPLWMKSHSMAGGACE